MSFSQHLLKTTSNVPVEADAKNSESHTEKMNSIRVVANSFSNAARCGALIAPARDFHFCTEDTNGTSLRTTDIA
jgi:hypothetical protein